MAASPATTASARTGGASGTVAVARRRATPLASPLGAAPGSPSKGGLRERLRQAVGGGRDLEASDLDDLLAAPIHIRWEIVRLAEMQAQGASIDARFPFISAAVANRKSNLAQAAEHLRKHERVAGDTHLLDNAPPTGKTVEYIEAFINGTGSDTDMLYRFVDDPVTDHDAVKLLLARDVNPNRVYHNGLTLLHLAAMKGDHKCVELLVEYGALLNVQCDAGYTPLHYACIAGQEEAALVLRRCDTDVTITNRAGHTALQCAASTGNRRLAVKIDRAIGVREEAVLRAKRFYVQLFEGNEFYWCEEDEEKAPEFFTGRMLAAVLLLKPSWLKGTRERRKLIPADLGNIERLAKKAFGKKKWEFVVDTFDYTHGKLMPRISKYIFKGLIHPLKVQSMLNAGREKYHKMIADREAARLEKLRRNTIEDFVVWLRNPDPVHRNAVFMEIYDIAARKSPITLTAIQDIVERETPLLVQEFDTMHPDDRECINHLWKVWIANRKRILGADDDDDATSYMTGSDDRTAITEGSVVSSSQYETASQSGTSATTATRLRSSKLGGTTTGASGVTGAGAGLGLPPSQKSTTVGGISYG